MWGISFGITLKEKKLETGIKDKRPTLGKRKNKKTKTKD
jgi:hypothetical protein